MCSVEEISNQRHNFMFTCNEHKYHYFTFINSFHFMFVQQ